MKISIAILSVIILASCSSIKSTTNTSKTLSIYGSGVIQKPVIVELDVQQATVTATSRGKLGTSVETLKAEAVSSAVKNANADVMVEPTYTIVNERGITTVTVKGFPATYKNFRDIKTEDIPLIKAGILQVAKVAEPTTVSKTKFMRNAGGL